MSLNKALISAARHYGPLVDPIAARYGISGTSLLEKLIQGESGGNPGAVSSAGARGYTQFMPGTRTEVLNRYGIDPWAGPDQAVHAAELHLRGRITGQTGLEGYNPGGGRGYIDYILGQHVGGTTGGTTSPVRAGGVTPGGRVTVTQPATQQPSLDAPAPETAGLLASLGQRAQPQPMQATVQDPAFSAQRYLKTAGAAPSVAPMQQPQRDLGPVLAALTGQGQTLPDAPASNGRQVTVTARAATANAPLLTTGSGHYPLGRRGKIIGTPYTGTHTLGNWQSDNAVDIGVPVGTPMVALDNGVVVKVRHHPQGSGRFAGDQITVQGAHGNSYFYAHGTSSVHPGEHVTRGQVIGRSGSANGVAHLHLGVLRGDPRKIIRQG